MSNLAVVYPSGFMGYDVGWPSLKETVSFDQKMDALRSASITAPKDKVLVINANIETLYKRYRQDRNLVRDQNFVADLISATANAFGTTNFYTWCYAQTKAPYFTASHRRFINEMFEFIQTGRRNYLITTWPALLKIRLATPEDANVDYNIREFFKAHPETMVVDVIASWLSQPFGVEDMLYTMQILFGRNE